MLPADLRLSFVDFSSRPVLRLGMTDKDDDFKLMLFLLFVIILLTAWTLLLAKMREKVR